MLYTTAGIEPGIISILSQCIKGQTTANVERKKNNNSISNQTPEYERRANFQTSSTHSPNTPQRAENVLRNIGI
jgi:hypothetical protein